MERQPIAVMEQHGDDVRRDLPGLLPRLWRFALVLTRDAHAAEDLLQATCVRVLERAHQFRPGTRLDRWTFSVMASISNNAWRAATRRRIEPMIDADAFAAEHLAPADLSLHARQVLSAVSDLPEGQRAAVMLVYVEGWSYREAAMALDIPIGTVMSRLWAARRSLTRRFGAEENAQ